MKKWISCFAAVLLVLAFSGAAFGADEPAAAPAPKYGSKVGDTMKPFKLNEPVMNKTFELKDLSNGRDTAIIFMQTACTLCVSEINEFVGVQDEIEPKLAVALVSVDFDAKRIPPYKAAYKIPFPILHDGDAAVLESVSFRATPAIVVVDSNGIIKQKMDGYDRAALKTLLKVYSK